MSVLIYGGTRHYPMDRGHLRPYLHGRQLLQPYVRIATAGLQRRTESSHCSLDEIPLPSIPYCPTLICHYPPVIFGHPPSAFGYRLSTFQFGLSTSGHRLSVFHYPP